MKKFTWFVALTPFIFISCKDDKVEPVTPAVPQLEIVVQPVYGTNNITETAVFTTVEGYDVQFTELKFFATDVKNGSKTLFDAGLFDWKSKGTSMITVAGNKADFSSIAANLGVGADINHLDPAAFANDNVLNISNSGDMHWDWNPGYIFMKVEAKVDTIPDGIPLFDHYVVFHVGKDEFLQTLAFENINWATVNDNLSRFSLKLDMEKFLQNGGQNIDLKTEFTCHTAPGQEALAEKIIQNFKASLSKL